MNSISKSLTVFIGLCSISDVYKMSGFPPMNPQRFQKFAEKKLSKGEHSAWIRNNEKLICCLCVPPGKCLNFRSQGKHGKILFFRESDQMDLILKNFTVYFISPVLLGDSGNGWRLGPWDMGFCCIVYGKEENSLILSFVIV